MEQSFKDIKLVWEYNRRGIVEILNIIVEKNNTKLISDGKLNKFGDGGLDGNKAPTLGARLQTLN